MRRRATPLVFAILLLILQPVQTAWDMAALHLFQRAYLLMLAEASSSALSAGGLLFIVESALAKIGILQNEQHWMLGIESYICGVVMLAVILFANIWLKQKGYRRDYPDFNDFQRHGRSY